MIDDSAIEDVVNSMVADQEEAQVEEEKHCDIDEEQLLAVIITRLKELDAEAKLETISPEAYQKCKSVMSQLLIYIENEFGFESMVDLIKITSEDIGHPLGPLDKGITKKLKKLGWIIDKKTNDVRPLNDDELVALFS